MGQVHGGPREETVAGERARSRGVGCRGVEVSVPLKKIRSFVKLIPSLQTVPANERGAPMIRPMVGPPGCTT